MRKNSAPADAEAVRLIRRASGLLSALSIMLMMLLACLLPREQLDMMFGLSRPAMRFVSQNRSADKTAPPEGASAVEVRITEVDADVAPEVAARLLSITAEVLDKQPSMALAGEGPKILIYHTHDTEAYTQTERFAYVPSGDWRTEDSSRSVIAVGEELARILNEEYHIETIHDTTAHEPPLITTAYARSLETMLRYKQQYPSLEMFIDLHRDGVSATGYENDFVTIDGTETARLMFVVGTGQGASGDPADPLPDFESNYSLALALTQKLLTYNDGLCRRVRVKTGRYNQHVSSKCILVEVGHNANTLEQALAAMPYLAAAIAEVSGVRPSGEPISFSP